MGDTKGKKEKAKEQKQNEARHAKVEQQRRDKQYPQTTPKTGQPGAGR
ncbi:MAG: hypothetical protein HY343_01245 [Lentisphaerae bacterium]|nr:hypothetical protein [Lentisphaerota bacterium]